jgi:hypothetical protein
MSDISCGRSISRTKECSHTRGLIHFVQAELDLLLFLKGRRIGIDIKRVDAPTMTPSMVSALKDLELHRLLVVYPGSTRYTLRSKVEVMSLAQCVAELA